MKKTSIILLFLIISIIANASNKETLPQSLNKALDRLDVAISQRDRYMQKQLQPIDSLKRQATKVEKTYLPQLYKQIGDKYHRCNIDSALYYYQKGIDASKDINNAELEQYLRLSHVALLPVQGVIKEAIEIYDSIAPNVFQQNKAHFYEVGNRLFYFASSFYPIKEYSEYYAQRAHVATDSLVKLIDKNSPEFHLYSAQLYADDNNQPMMIAEFSEVINTVQIEDLSFARATSHMSDIYKEQKGKEEQHLYYLALASLSDIYSGTLEGTALQRLGVAIFNKGDINRAYRYLALSLNNAVESGSRIRALQTAEAYPIIAQSFKKQDETKLTWLTWLVVALIIALILIASSLIFLRKEMKQLNEMKIKLSQANVTKDTYISQFLSLSSIYIEKLDKFHRVAKRKLKANQVSDLYELLESGKMLTEQSQMFYKIFDNAFIHIYPTFVNDVNNLLVEDKRFDLHDMKLNTELRILAFLRLGIDDSEQIAQFLGLSLNTIYTYRNRLKSRAINRNTFDADVMKIGAID